MEYNKLLGNKYQVQKDRYSKDTESYTVVTPEIWDKYSELSREILLTSDGMLFVVNSNMLAEDKKTKKQLEDLQDEFNQRVLRDLLQEILK